MRSFWWALGYALRRKGQLVIAMVLSLVAGLLRAASFGALIPFLDVLLNNGRPPGYFNDLPEKVPDAIAPGVTSMISWLQRLEPVQMLGVVASFLLGVVALRGILVVIQEVITARITFDAIRRLAFDVYAAILSAPMVFEMGGLLGRFSADLEDVRIGIRRATGRFYREPINVVMIVGTLLLMHARLALVSMLVFPVAAAVTILAARAVKRGARRVLKYRSTLMGLIEQGLRGLTTIRVFGLEQRERERFERQNRSLARRLVRLALIESLHRPVLEIVGSMAVVACLMLGFGYVQGGELSAGTFIAFYTALVSLVDPLRKLSNTNMILQRAAAGSERLHETFIKASSTHVASGDLPLPRPVTSLELRGTSVQLGGESILRDVSCRVERGEMLVVAGLSGSGKTTLLSLLPRLIDPTAGEIRINDGPITRIDTHSLRSGIGFVGQDLFLFNETVADNLLAARPDADMEEVVAAARAAQADEFIRELPDGYQTVLGERGLSAGQRQRLTIARALLRDPQILILDEATSALDRFHETKLIEELRCGTAGRITILVTHRLDAVPDDARILLLDRGEVVAQGTKRELAEGDEHFRLVTTLSKPHASPAAARSDEEDHP